MNPTILRFLRRGLAPGASLLLLLTGLPISAQAAPTYVNPLSLVGPQGQAVQTCADPFVIKGQAPGDSDWYLYCTTDPLDAADRDSAGRLRFRPLPMYRSTDLVNWRYQGEAFAAAPAVAAPTAALWAPEVHYFNGQYSLYFTITDVADAQSPEPGCAGDSAIGVATSASPIGPWSASPKTVVAPRRSGPGCKFFWTFDPNVVITPGGEKFIYYGSYDGGMFVQALSDDGLSTVGPATQVTTASRYEATQVVFKDGFYYLFASATNCCNGPLTGYAVFVGRALQPTGPFVDREGQSMLDARVGGTPVIVQNGNRWIGPGHNAVFRGPDGGWWTIYHAVDKRDPYLGDGTAITKRPALLDRLDWIDGWPVLDGGRGPSDALRPAPTAPRGDITQRAAAPGARNGPLLWADEFNASALDKRWSWVRPPPATAHAMEAGTLRFDTQDADLIGDKKRASVLAARLPATDFIVEARVRLDLPLLGCCSDYVQAGLAIYGDDDHFIKLVHVAMADTRQTEFALKTTAVPKGSPSYGNTVVGPPAEWTHLRIVAIRHGRETQYTAYTRQDASAWVRGGTWSTALGVRTRLGLVAMGGAGYKANFDYVRVYRLVTARNAGER